LDIEKKETQITQKTKFGQRIGAKLRNINALKVYKPFSKAGFISLFLTEDEFFQNEVSI
jgi:hypothetical protein